MFYVVGVSSWILYLLKHGEVPDQRGAIMVGIAVVVGVFTVLHSELSEVAFKAGGGLLEFIFKTKKRADFVAIKAEEIEEIHAKISLMEEGMRAALSEFARMMFFVLDEVKVEKPDIVNISNAAESLDRLLRWSIPNVNERRKWMNEIGRELPNGQNTNEDHTENK